MALNNASIDITSAKDLPYYARGDFYYAVVNLEKSCPRQSRSALNIERLAIVSRQELENLLKPFLNTRSIGFLPQMATLLQTSARYYVDKDNIKRRENAEYHWKPLDTARTTPWPFARELVDKIFRFAVRPYDYVVVELYTPLHGAAHFQIAPESQKSALRFASIDTESRNIIAGPANEETSQASQRVLGGPNLKQNWIEGQYVVRISDIGPPLSGASGDLFFINPDKDILYLNPSRNGHLKRLVAEEFIKLAAKCKKLAFPYLLLKAELSDQSPFIEEFLAKMIGCQELIVVTGKIVTRSYIGQIPLTERQGKTLVASTPDTMASYCEGRDAFMQTWDSAITHVLKDLADVTLWFADEEFDFDRRLLSERINETFHEKKIFNEEGI